MTVDQKDLLDEFRQEVDEKRRAELIDEYIKKPSADAMSAKALELLADDIDAIDKP